MTADEDEDFTEYNDPEEYTDADIERLLEKGRKREAKWAAMRNEERGARSTVPTDVTVVCKEIVESGYRVLAKERHPDVGGSPTDMVRLNAAVTCLRGIV